MLPGGIISFLLYDNITLINHASGTHYARHAGKAIINVGQHQVLDLKWLAQGPQPALMAFGFPVALVADGSDSKRMVAA